MTNARPSFFPRLKRSGILISSGLTLEMATLFWPHPLSFVVFLAAAALLVAPGVLLYLWAITGPEKSERTPG